MLDPIPDMLAFTHTTELRPCDDGGMFYRDSHHLSAYGSRMLDPMLKPVAARSAIQTATRTVTSSATAERR